MLGITSVPLWIEMQHPSADCSVVFEFISAPTVQPAMAEPECPICFQVLEKEDTVDDIECDRSLVVGPTLRPLRVRWCLHHCEQLQACEQMLATSCMVFASVRSDV